MLDCPIMIVLFITLSTAFEVLSLLDSQIELFMSHMNYIQGEKKISEWKGSVMNSIVGAYLAQNVNDAISSPTFMLLAAIFSRNSGSVLHKGNHMLKKIKP